MAKRRSRRRPRLKAPTTGYPDEEGNVLTLRDAVSPGTAEKIREARAAGAATTEDDWQRRTELLFERLAVRWEVAGLPIDDQKTLLGRYRMADGATREWVRRTLDEHVAVKVPELAD